jgi:hypothetical protein
MDISSSVGPFFLTTAMVGKYVQVLITCVYKSNAPQMQWAEYERHLLVGAIGCRIGFALTRYTNAWLASQI